MKKVLLALVVIVVLIVGGVFVAASMQSGDYRMERSIMTKAVPGAVYNIMCDWNRFNEWSPFIKLDPASKVVVEGPKCEVGHVYTWEGNDDAGAGKMTITKLEPNQQIDVGLEFTR